MSIEMARRPMESLEELTGALGISAEDLRMVDIDDVRTLVQRLTHTEQMLGSHSADDEYQRRAAQAEQTGNPAVLASFTVARRIAERSYEEYQGRTADGYPFGGAYGTLTQRAELILQKLRQYVSYHGEQAPVEVVQQRVAAQRETPPATESIQ